MSIKPESKSGAACSDGPSGGTEAALTPGLYPEAKYLRDLADRFESPQDESSLRHCATQIELLHRDLNAANRALSKETKRADDAEEKMRAGWIEVCDTEIVSMSRELGAQREYAELVVRCAKAEGYGGENAPGEPLHGPGKCGSILCHAVWLHEGRVTRDEFDKVRAQWEADDCPLPEVAAVPQLGDSITDDTAAIQTALDKQFPACKAPTIAHAKGGHDSHDWNPDPALYRIGTYCRACKCSDSSPEARKLCAERPAVNSSEKS